MKRVMRLLFVVVVLVLAAALVLSSCKAGGKAAGNVIKIGYTAPLINLE